MPRYRAAETVSKKVEKSAVLSPVCHEPKGIWLFSHVEISEADGGNTENQHFSNYEEGGIRHGGFPHRKGP